MQNRNRSSRRSRSRPSSSSWSIAGGFAAGLGLALFVLGAASPGCHSKAQPGEAAFADPAYAKLDSDLRRLTKDLTAAGHADSSLSILVKVKEGTDCRSKLETAGMRIESTMGDIVTGQATVKALPQVATLNEVIEIQAARTYHVNETEAP